MVSSGSTPTNKTHFKGLEATGIRKILKIELAVRPDSDQRGMTASGMVVINPSWQLEQQMKSILPYLTKRSSLKVREVGQWNGLCQNNPFLNIGQNNRTFKF